jgi:hypothetical protein
MQSGLSQSSTEAELVAVTDLSNEIVWWRRLWADLGHPPDGPVTIFVDNRATTVLADHTGNFSATRHIDLKHFVVRSYVKDGTVAVRWVSKDHQLADVLTKNVGVGTFQRLVSGVMGENV